MHDDLLAAVERHRLHRRLEHAVADVDDPAPPLVVVDLDAFDANAADLVDRAAGTPIRVASKSLRVPALISRVLARPGFQGVLAYALREALWLAENKVSDDIVIAYPTVDEVGIRRLVASTAAAAITLMIDDTAQLDLVDRNRGDSVVQVRVALDIDAGLHLGPGHVGPKRSPLRDTAAVLRLAQAVIDRPGFHLAGVMTYEGQVAGVPDDVPGKALKSLAVRRLKDASLHQLVRRRAEIAEGLATMTALEFWNAGGSGSVQMTAADPVVTEIAAGSGLLVPTLFDHYRSFTPRPAAFFAVPVVRRPGPDTVTVAGGGFVASGAAGPDRLPTPWTPPGLTATALEGVGEVQTPLVGPGATGLSIGDRVWFRHAKSGELAEHTPLVHLISGDGINAHVVETVPTYRGVGAAW